MCFSMHWRRRHWIGPSTNQCMERCTFLDSVLHLAARLTWIFCDEFAAFFSFNRCLAVCYLDFCNTSKLWTTIAVLHMTLQKTNWALKARLFDHVRGGVNHARWILNFFFSRSFEFFPRWRESQVDKNIGVSDFWCSMLLAASKKLQWWEDITKTAGGGWWVQILLALASAVRNCLKTREPRAKSMNRTSLGS